MLLVRNITSSMHLIATQRYTKSNNKIYQGKFYNTICVIANFTLLKIYSLLYKHGTYSEEWFQLTFQLGDHSYWQVLLPESLQMLMKKDENVHGFAIRGEL